MEKRCHENNKNYFLKQVFKTNKNTMNKTQRYFFLSCCIGIIHCCLFLHSFRFEVHAAEQFSEEAWGRQSSIKQKDYLIGAGDILEIMIWKNEELSKILPVRPDGKISLPLIGDIIVEGKSIAQLSGELQNTYSRYVTDPILYITVQQIRSMNFYIIGEVNAAGARPINTKTNVLQGLAMASGLTPFAKADEIKIFRTKDDGTTAIFQFDYDDVSRGRNLSQNILLERGDVIVVP